MDTYQSLMEEGYRVLWVHGDTDWEIPVDSSRICLDRLKLTTKDPWKYWVSPDL